MHDRMTRVKPRTAAAAIGGTVAWRLRAQYKDANDAGPEFEESYPFGPLPLLPVGTPWSVAASVGGTLTVEWSLNGGPTQTGFQFTVLGNDPGRQVITSCTNEPWCVGNEPWFFTRLIMQEST